MSAENRRFTVIALADGVSTCSMAGHGARIACDAIIELMLKRGDYFMECKKNDAIESILCHVQYKLKNDSERTGVDAGEYSSTLACVAIDRKTKKVFYFSLGDSMIFSVVSGACGILAKASDSCCGCPVTTSRGAAECAVAGVAEKGSLDSVMICSDGAWRTFFKHDTMKTDVQNMLCRCEYVKIGQFLENSEVYDDHSFISLEMNKKRRKAA